MTSTTIGTRVQYRYWPNEEFHTGTVVELSSGVSGVEYVHIKRDGYRETAVLPTFKFDDAELVRSIDIDKALVASVYTGGMSKCACGCSGTHRYASAWRQWASDNRGYEVNEDEVSDRQVTRVVNKIARIAEVGGTIEVHESRLARYISAEQDGRMYVAYLVDAATEAEYQACIDAEQHAAELQYNNGR